MAFTRLFVAALLARRVISDATCYFPDRKPAQDFTTCNATAPYSACCRPEDVCLSNGFCLQQGSNLANRLIRGACTDDTFSNPACPSRCVDTAPTTAVSIYLAYDARPHGNFCCVRNFNVTSGQCQTPSQGSTEPFSLRQGTVIYDRRSGILLPQNWTDSDVAAATVTVTAEDSGSGSGSSNTAIIGVAVPLAVLLLAALAGCLVLWRQLRKVQATYNAHNFGGWREGRGPKQDEGYGTATGYAAVNGQPHTMQHHPELPSHHQKYIAEAPTETEVQMADSRSVGR